MKVYSMMVNDLYETQEDAIEAFKGYVESGFLMEEEPQEDNIKYTQFVESYKGADLYYDYGADYYFIADSEEA